MTPISRGTAFICADAKQQTALSILATARGAILKDDVDSPLGFVTSEAEARLDQPAPRQARDGAAQPQDFGAEVVAIRRDDRISARQGILCMPLIGKLDSARGIHVTNQLLETVVKKRARCAIVDTTGTEFIDSATAPHLARIARSVRLLGAECVLTGITPELARQFLGAGIEATELVTYQTMRDALSVLVQRKA